MEDGTYNQARQPVTHESGFQVGLWTTTTNAENIENVIKTITRTWSGEWGIWTDSNTSEIFVEPCVWLPSLDVALAVGALYEQRTVWSWVLMGEVEV